MRKCKPDVQNGKAQAIELPPEKKIARGLQLQMMASKS
jgi:hypothetical protein